MRVCGAQRLSYICDRFARLLLGSFARHGALARPCLRRLPHMAALLHTAARRRLWVKQRVEPFPALPPEAPAARGVPLAVEVENVAVLCADGLLPLPLTAKRRHIHWTHCRTRNPGDVQPESLSRGDFWLHLLRCYREAYPRAETETGTVLEFGLACKELHKDAEREEDRSVHYHAATFATQQVYWKKIRDISEKKYRIKLHAVAHEAYVTMFKYLRQASWKKPIHELDPTPYFSPGHPQGEALKDLLAVGAKYLEVRAQKLPAPPVEPLARSQFGVVFNWVVDHGLRGAVGVAQLKDDALTELKAGRPKLIDFVKKHRACLQDQLDFCWELVGAREQVVRLRKSRQQLLLEAATDTAKVCANGHSRCAEAYESILAHHGVPSLEFRQSLFETLQSGRLKGSALMIVGGKDTGKTTITEPASHVFKAMPTPQADSFCPLQDIRGHELFLWHDFRYSPGHPRQDERGLRLDEGTWNRWLEGLPTLIGVAKTDGSRGDFVYDEDAAFIFTGPFKLEAYKNGRVDARETEQLTCRLKYVVFDRAAPERLNRGLKPCAACWSRWLLRGACAWQESQGAPATEFMQEVKRVLGAPPVLAAPEAFDEQASQGALPSQPASSEAHRSQVFNELSQLMAWRSQGMLTDAEFALAKERILRN